MTFRSDYFWRFRVSSSETRVWWASKPVSPLRRLGHVSSTQYAQALDGYDFSLLLPQCPRKHPAEELGRAVFGFALSCGQM